jgi:hypothetical protein
MDKITGNDIDINTIEQLNLANLGCLNTYKEMLDSVEYMHQNLLCAQMFENDERLDKKVAISDEIISEMAVIAQQYVKITFLLDKLENLLKSE